MKKYLNKGLLYAWFNCAKTPIIIGLFVWGFIANIIIKDNLFQLKRNIASEFSNDLYTIGIDQYFMLGIIFVAIYFISKGINKRNTEMFLSSGPYTKKQIKYNDLISLIITLVFFIITYAYIALMAYVRNREFLAIVEGYKSIMLIEIARITLIGTIGIIFMLIIDSMFSNSVIGVISMISVAPISIALVIGKFISILSYFGFKENYSLLEGIRRLILGNSIEGDYVETFRIILLERESITKITFKQLSIEIIIGLICILIMLIIFNIAQTKYKLECSNKIFSSKTNENIVVILVSAALGSLASFIFVSEFVNDMQHKSGDYLPLFGLELLKGLGADILCVAIVGFVGHKIMKKVLKNIV